MQVADFVKTQRSWLAQVSAANTNRDGTGTLVDVAAAVANGPGLIIEELFAKAAVTTTDGQVRLFLDDGSNTRLFEELAIPAATVSATVQSAAVESSRISKETPLRLQAGWTLKASTHNAEAINIVASGGEF